ncbi:cell wall-binding repeat-containing protein [Sutcliffiella deserti]|uniref:cell wall-binding repeat-containing protein n=1 Tax=Sutcliffiella deserti TaxID=2875501 RepID=UPI001CBBEA56|nr:cell wall-binding repeat-containing protein [Sutcliffiella deserti]
MLNKNKLILMVLSCLLVLPHSISAQQINSECVQPSVSEIDRMLTEEALAQDVPPEIVKAIAFIEADGWVHCENGETLISGDGGIGIMQVTDVDGWDIEKLHTDISYNIKAGVTILNSKYGYNVIPKLNDQNKDILENWYFAVMAYNGIVHINSPSLKDENGKRNMESYQDRVFTQLQDSNPGINLNLDLDEVKFEDLIYRDNGTLGFRKSSYILEGPIHSTRQKYEKGDLVVATAGARYRSFPDTRDSENIKGTLQREVVMIDDTFAYDQSDNNFNHFLWYSVITRNEENSGYVASSNLTPFGKRIYGDNRYETAVEISKQGWEEKADTVILARGDTFPDALAGAPLAYKLDAPILLTRQTALHDKTEAEIKRLGAKHVIILGGTEAISVKVSDKLTSIGVTNVERIGGDSRYDTARKIANRLGGNPEKAILAHGDNFPDSLSVAPYAAKHGYPILLTKTDRLHESTTQAIEDTKVNSMIVVGGVNAISEGVLNKLPENVSTDRIAGETRYATAVKIIEEFNLPTDIVYTATGRDFPDALTGSVLAAKNNSSILLVDDKVRPDTTNFIRNSQLDTFHVLGGRPAVSDTAVNNLVVD